jgi:hypothetical protein
MAVVPIPAPAVIEAAQAGSSLLLDALETYGCALVREVLPAALLQSALRRANAHFFRASYSQTSAELAALDAVPLLSLGSTPRPEGGTVADIVAALAASRPWHAFSALYPELGVAAGQSRLQLARPADDPDAGFRQWGTATRQRNLGFTFWIPLIACGEEAPSLELVARRTTRLLPVKEGVGIAIGDLAPAQRSALWSPVLALGDLLIFDPFTLHRDAVRGDMRQARIAVECRVLRRRAAR